MTGGQKVDGAMSIEDLTRALEAEGVKKILVVGDHPRSKDVWPRERLDEAQRLLREIPGTTVLIYEQECAAELRRKRRRGLAARPERRVFIHSAVCEGCGDCGVKSNCMSLHPVETELGRKTRVHQSSCNQDYSCLDGDCPSFLEVFPGRKNEAPAPKREEVELPRPENRTREASIYMTGIGGTGVVTANQILATAAALEGKKVLSLDQTGLSQKGGPVVSHLKIFSEPREASSQIAAGEADLYLAFDVLTAAASQHLTRARPDLTVAVVSTSAIPTGRMVSHVDESFPQLDVLRRRIDAHTRAGENLYLDAVALAERFFHDHMPANTILLGAAYQKGLLPLSKWSLEKAIELNGTSVDVNRSAFGLGRRLAFEPGFPGEGEPVRPASFERRVAELTLYQNEAYAHSYSDFIDRVREREREAVGNGSRLTDAVSRGLFKLMAYKDEYEVARLSTRPELDREIEEAFGEGARFRYMLHPPVLRAMGVKHKIAFGAWFRPFLRLLAKLKFLRGTALDPFGYARVRRVERALIDEYRSLIARRLQALSRENYEATVALAELADGIRGYEEVKLENVERFRSAVAKMEAP
jgi:indolepyruvate ferredoxin oxidoreductase